MISPEDLEKLARQQQTGLFPNTIREYFQHAFLAELYHLPEADRLLFKGGTALRILYGSPRFSEDLDFSLFGVPRPRVKSFVEGLLVKTLAGIERTGVQIDVGAKSDATSGGYFGAAIFKAPDVPPVRVEINVSARAVKGHRGEVDSVACDFVPTYTVVHLPQKELVEEKVFGALRERKKPRDFYDLYFMMRRGMFTLDQKKRLAKIKEEIIAQARKINFRGELGAFLPANQKMIIRDFVRTLEAELRRN